MDALNNRHIPVNYIVTGNGLPVEDLLPPHASFSVSPLHTPPSSPMVQSKKILPVIFEEATTPALKQPVAKQQNNRKRSIPENSDNKQPFMENLKPAKQRRITDMNLAEAKLYILNLRQQIPK